MEFVPIRVSTLRGDQKIDFDIYVKVAGKHILYCRKGDSFEGERLKRLRDKKLKQMFINPDSEEAYRKYLTINIESAYEGSKNRTIEERAQIIHGAQQAATEDLMENADNMDFYRIAKHGSTRYIEFLFKNKESLRNLVGVENTDKAAAHHGVTVATYAVALAQELGFQDEMEKLAALAMGCMVHDIEHQHNGLVISKKFEEFTDEEKSLYLNHPGNGAARLQGLQHWDPLVLEIVVKHHEKISGEGFPRKLRERDLSDWVTIASTANAYDRIVSFEGKSQKEAMKQLMVDSIGTYPLPQLKALQKMLQSKGVI